MKPDGFATVGISPADASACRQPAQCLLPGGALLGAELCSIWADALEAAMLEADERRVGERLKANVDVCRYVFGPVGLCPGEREMRTGPPADHASDLEAGVGEGVVGLDGAAGDRSPEANLAAPLWVDPARPAYSQRGTGGRGDHARAACGSH
jgi:hypothetical protein